jgi:hypothetical protein
MIGANRSHQTLVDELLGEAMELPASQREDF